MVRSCSTCSKSSISPQIMEQSSTTFSIVDVKFVATVEEILHQFGNHGPCFTQKCFKELLFIRYVCVLPQVNIRVTQIPAFVTQAKKLDPISQYLAGNILLERELAFPQFGIYSPKIQLQHGPCTINLVLDP